MGRQGQSRTPGQGQDTYPAESNVTAILEVTGESGKGRIFAILEVFAISKVIGVQSHRHL